MAEITACPSVKRFPLEMECDHSCQRARRDIVRAAERREEVIQRIVVSQIDNRDLTADFVLVAVKQVVMSESEVEETPRGDALRIMIVILLIRPRDPY